MLGTDELPLVILAAAGHSDTAFRHGLARRLDDATEAGRPMHSVKELRDFFARHHGTRRNRFVLSPLARDIAVRALRLIFAEGKPRQNAQWVRLASGTSADNADGFLINADLEPRYLNRIVYTEHRRKQRTWQAQVLAGRAATRLTQFQQREPLLRAVCRVEDGFCLEVTGDLPWRHEQGLLRQSFLGGRPLATLEMTAELSDSTVRVRTTTAESMIRFSAALARGERLVLRCTGSYSRRVIVQLRSFEEEVGTMPVVACYSGGEAWLRNVPSPNLILSADDRLALARWAYPLGAWLDEPMTQRLL